jgi:hypothetical protein
MVLMRGLCELRCVLRDSLIEEWDKKMGRIRLGECTKNEARRGEFTRIYTRYGLISRFLAYFSEVFNCLNKFNKPQL